MPAEGSVDGDKQSTLDILPELLLMANQTNPGTTPPRKPNHEEGTGEGGST
jgi:hypothetical protein